MVVALEAEDVVGVKAAWFNKCNNQGHLSLQQLQQLQCQRRG